MRRNPARLSGRWTVYRQTDIDPRLPVLWRPGSQRAPNPQPTGRWHVAGEGYAQYFSTIEDGAWAEFIRAREIHSPGQVGGMLRHMWICEVTEAEIADLRTRAAIRKAGLEPQWLVGPYERCHEIARALLEAGYRGILSPNAALEGVANLTLLGPREEHHIPLGEEFDRGFASPEIVEVKLLRAGAQPPVDLIERVRQKDALAETYRSWPSESNGQPVVAT